MAALGFPGQFQAGLTTGYKNIGAVQKQNASNAGFPGTFQAGLTTGYTNIGAVQKVETGEEPPGGVTAQGKGNLLLMGCG